MKKRLLFGILILSIFTTIQAQTQIGLIGDFNSWGGDVFLTTTDDVNYTLNNFVVPADGELKFRQDADWVINWGSDTFPGGTGVQDGPNIPAIAGTYNVTINIVTGVYFFENMLGINDIVNDIELFYINNTININGYTGNVSICAYDETGRIVNFIAKTAVINNYSRSFELPKNQIIIIKLQGDNFKKTIKVISK